MKPTFPKLHRVGVAFALLLIVASCVDMPWKEGAKVALAYQNIEHYYDLDRPLELLGRADLSDAERETLREAALVAEDVRERVDYLEDNLERIPSQLLVVKAEYARIAVIYRECKTIFFNHADEYATVTRQKLESFHRDVTILDREFRKMLDQADKAAAVSQAGETIGLLLRAAVLHGV